MMRDKKGFFRSKINDVLRIKKQKNKKINHIYKLYVQFFYRK